MHVVILAFAAGVIAGHLLTSYWPTINKALSNSAEPK